ncbi:hypothetical protein QBC44DRAFT_365279 [Cladorrhinum sp. PSN332]|nr:hypothetical protein QBC44DRAFT_365279 [Cladorrhinum sp. PSN332]
MSPFLDRAHLQALPALEAIASNDSLRSLHRFERDDPLPYVGCPWPQRRKGRWASVRVKGWLWEEKAQV